MLAARAIDVTAVTGKEARARLPEEARRARGAAAAVASISASAPLEKPLWAAAFDSVGGEQLAWLTRTMQPDGLIASFGNAGGIELKTTVLPFILRGVRLIGVDSREHADAAAARRSGSGSRPISSRGTSIAIAYTIGLDELPAQFDKLLKGTGARRARWSSDR